MSLYGKKSMYVMQSLFPLRTGRGSARPGWRESRKSTYEGEVKLRSWMDGLVQLNNNLLRSSELVDYNLNIDILIDELVGELILSGSEKPYVANIKLVLTNCKFSQELFIVGG